MEPRFCKECDEQIEGRIDKKFCSDQCRNTHNNNLNSDTNNHTRNVNRILKKNRRILFELNPKGKSGTTKEKLLILGFRFNYITSYYRTRKGSIYQYCYDQGFIKTGQNYFYLVHKKDYLD